MRKKILLIIFSVIVITLISGYFYISSIDWNKHKDIISKNFFETTGKEIVFSGPVSLSIFPYPVLKATNVQIKNPNAYTDDADLMSIKSLNSELELLPLLRGRFEVTLVTLLEPTINILRNPSGECNWLQNIDDSVMNKLKNSKLLLKSLTIQNATLNYRDEKNNKQFQLTSLNAETLAQSLLGPFNIDGSYIKDKQPAGFSIVIGELSNRFATTLNFALSHPASKTIVRFDGSFLKENNSFNGDVVFSSQEFKAFVDSNMKNYKLSEKYNYPLTFNLEVAKNKEKTVISNFVFSYGQTKGSANILIPYNVGSQASAIPQIETAFNFTQLDLEPLAFLFSQVLVGKETIPPIEFDIKSSFNILNAQYNNENIKNISFELGVEQNIFNLEKFVATLVKESTLKAQGQFYMQEANNLAYSINADFNSNDFFAVLTWLNVAPKKHNAGTYKKAKIAATIEGNNEQIKISEINALIDRTTAKGNIGILRNERPNILFAVDFDSINLNDYLFIDAKNNSDSFFGEVLHKLSETSILKDFDAQINTKAKLLILDSTPVEEFSLAANLTLGDLNISELSATNVNDAELTLSGIVKEVGTSSSLSNMKYKIVTNNFNSFLDKSAINFPFISSSKLDKVNAQGIISGTEIDYNTKAIFDFNNFSATYSGNIKKEGAKYNGTLEVASPDFLNFVKTLGFKYEPLTYSLGNLSFSSKVSSDNGDANFTDLSAKIGNNTFYGDVSYKKRAKPEIKADLSINKFDTKRFIYNPEKNEGNNSIIKDSTKKHSFVKKPSYSNQQINYDFYKSFNLEANLDIGELDVQDIRLDKANVVLDIKDDKIAINNLKATLNNAPLVAQAVIDIEKTPSIKGEIILKNQKLPSALLQGDVYKIVGQSFNIEKASFETVATSKKDAFENLSASANVSIAGLIIKGIDLNKVFEDVVNRDTPTNLLQTIRNYLESGETHFGNTSFNININGGDFNFAKNFNLGRQAINLSSKGFLKNWTMDTSFLVNFSNATFIAPYSFILGPSIDNPTLTIKAQELIDILNKKQEAFDKQKKLREEIEKQTIIKEMLEVQQEAQSIKKDLIELQNQNLLVKQSKANDLKAKKAYQSLINKISPLITELDKTFLQSKAVEYTEEMIGTIKSSNAKVKEEIEDINNEVNELYLSDTKEAINVSFAKINDDFNRSKEIARSFNTKIAEIKDKLKEIKSSQTVIDSINTSSASIKVKEYANRISFVHNLAEKEYNNSLASNNIDLLASILNIMTENKAITANDIKELSLMSENEIKKAQDIFNKENSLYQETQRVKEIENIIKENTSTISTESKGVVTIKKDLQEIKKIEEKALKVLDFSKEKVTKTKTETPEVIEGVVIIQE